MDFFRIYTHSQFHIWRNPIPQHPVTVFSVFCLFSLQTELGKLEQFSKTIFWVICNFIIYTDRWYLCYHRPWKRILCETVSLNRLHIFRIILNYIFTPFVEGFSKILCLAKSSFSILNFTEYKNLYSFQSTKRTKQYKRWPVLCSC